MPGGVIRCVHLHFCLYACLSVKQKKKKEKQVNALNINISLKFFSFNEVEELFHVKCDTHRKKLPYICETGAIIIL